MRSQMGILPVKELGPIRLVLQVLLGEQVVEVAEGEKQLLLPDSRGGRDQPQTNHTLNHALLNSVETKKVHT